MKDKNCGALITDKPHSIKDCSGRGFVIFDAAGCRVTINGVGDQKLAEDFILAYNTMMGGNNR